jgi:hypothetical protein
MSPTIDSFIDNFNNNFHNSEKKSYIHEILPHNTYNLRVYDEKEHRMGVKPPDTLFRIIDKIKDRLLTRREFLPQLKNKANKLARSELRETCALVLSYLTHHANLESYNSDGQGDIHVWNSFTIDNISIALKKSWSATQRAIGILIKSGYLKKEKKRKYYDKANPLFYASFFNLTAKLFAHIDYAVWRLKKALSFATASKARKIKIASYGYPTSSKPSVEIFKEPKEVFDYLRDKLKPRN